MKTRRNPALPARPAAARRSLGAGLALAATLTFVVLASMGSAVAQTGGFCSRFDSGTDGFGPCPTHPNITVGISTSGGISPSDPYLRLTDLSGASAACSSDRKYAGNWIEKVGGCGQFCFDFKIFHAGYPPAPITPQISIYGPGMTPRATFVANFTVTPDDPWRQKICVPIKTIQPGEALPSSASGGWSMSGSTGYDAAWNTLITNVATVQLPIDFTKQPSEIAGYDNICISEGGCGDKPKDEVTGCLKDTRVAVKCNPDGSYTVTLDMTNVTGISASSVTLSPQTAGITVSPPQQPWAATTTWTITGAKPGQTVAFTADATQAGGGKEPGADLCCSGEIKITMPECPQPQTPLDVKLDKEIADQADSLVTFRLNVANAGPAFSNGAFTITDTIPAGMNVTGISGPWSCTPATLSGPGTLTCTYNVSGAIATGFTLPSILVNVRVTGPGPWQNCATVAVSTPSGADGNPANDTSCVPVQRQTKQVGELIVKKEVRSNGPLPVPAGLTFPVTVTCGSWSQTFNLIDNVPQSTGNVPLNTDCTVAETPPPPPAICPPKTTPTWATTHTPSNPFQLSGITTTVTVTNTLECRPEAAPLVTVACDPRTTVKRGNVCACRHPSMARASASACACREGTNFVPGRGCVRRAECRAPAKPNRTGTACVCPQGMQLRGNTCVEREQRRPAITPDDVIRVVPGLIGPRGGGGGGPSRGGGGAAAPDTPRGVR